MNELFLSPGALRMHETAIFPLPVKIWRYHRIPRPRFPLRRGNFGNSATNKGYIAYFYCACAKRPYFHFRSKIWRHRRVPRSRFPFRWGNFGDSAKNDGYIAYFYCAVVTSRHVTKMAATLVDPPWHEPPLIRRLHGSISYTSEVIAN